MKLTPRESFILYGFVLGFVFVFYLLGLVVGRSHFVEATPKTENVSVSDDPVPDLKSELDFYQQMMKPPAGQSDAAQDILPAPVSGEAVTHDQPDLDALSESDSSQMYTVQVGAFTAESEAQQILLRLGGRGYSGNLRFPSQLDRYYRVSVGQFESEAAARQMESLLRKDGFLTYVKKLQVSSPAN